MPSNITPKNDYLLCEEVKDATGAVVTSDISDHWQKYKVLALGDGHYNELQNIWIEQVAKVGDIVYVQKHSEADSPEELKTKGLYLIQDSRIMAVEEGDK